MFTRKMIATGNVILDTELPLLTTEQLEKVAEYVRALRLQEDGHEETL